MIKKILPFVPVALIFLFLITVLILFNLEKGRNSHVLFFPLDGMNGKNAEIRNIYRSSDPKHRIDLFISELILGPVELELNSFMPEGTKIKASIWSGNSLYLDFNKDFILDTPRIPLSYTEKIDYLQRNIKFNFPHIKEIVVTVEGQIPGSEFYYDSEKIDS
ncbi:hypothetical protein EXM22_05695 [Oceanispirochaeta crateris]|uniref:GerMN domain-containing protein n=1 Tax=Oceanispirochaeta crateris TaxID=2518645 RepID=A0A5C1QLT4_9SPIO|nr:GerMN domain-containing protein [Oceanispirochaeta crateris]QEN07506.1 hypothetical protein EXM22_05695 [Oceanispirochaeta crateris]